MAAAPLARDWRPPRRTDHNRVEPTDAVGMGVRIPVEHLEWVAELVAPCVPRARIARQTSFITLYATMGTDDLNGRRVGHRWVNVISDPPPGVDPIWIGGFAYIGSAGSPIGRMWARVGQVVVPGTVRLSIDRRQRRAEFFIGTAGGTVSASAEFDARGERWTYLPQRYYLMDPARPIHYRGDEWGLAHAGRASVRATGSSGSSEFEADASVDLEVGWDYVFRPYANDVR